MDKSDSSIIDSFANGKQPFLTDLTKDQDTKVKLVKGRIKVKRKPTWDEQRVYSLKVADILDSGKCYHEKQAARIRKCAEKLEMGFVEDFLGNPVLKLKTAYFCRVRNCPVCQWRRAKMWSARFFDALPRIFSDYPEMRFIFVTFTVANCPVSELRSTVQLMNNAWGKMSRLKKFPALGFVRSLEVTKEKNHYDKSGKKLIRAARPDYCHPHFHVLMAVPKSYFNNNYLSKDDYAEMWQKSLKVDYKPVCDVRIVKPKELLTDSNGVPVDEKTSVYEGLKAAIVEVVKYTVKPSDMVQSTDWLLELVGQLHKTRAVSLGGIFKDYMKVDDDDLLTPTEREGNQGGLMFGWLGDVKRYRFSHFKNKDSDSVRSSKAFYSHFRFMVVPHFCLLSPRAQCLVIRELGF
jgi:plasmid rolling circle replication initiator protein Rep